MHRYFLIPIHSTPLLLVVTFALGLKLAVAAGLAGFPLAFLLFSWFFKYCFVLLDSVVAGEDEPPVLSIEMVNPVSEQRPLVLAALAMAEGLLLWRVRPAALIALAAVLPAQVAAASAWDDLRPADKLANDLVATLLARRETGEALLIVEQRLASNPKYQVMPEAVAVRLAELAGAAGKKALQRRISAGTGATDQSR